MEPVAVRTRETDNQPVGLSVQFPFPFVGAGAATAVIWGILEVNKIGDLITVQGKSNTAIGHASTTGGVRPSGIKAIDEHVARSTDPGQ